MAQDDVDRSQEFRRCIGCWLCQGVCHVIRDHEDNKPAYAGPRYFIRHAELDMHPLDTGDRRQPLREEQGLGLCNITKCCTEVCPAGIKITDNVKEDLAMRVDYQKVFPAGLRAMAELPRTGAPDDVYATVEAEFAQEETAVLTLAIVAIDGWNRLAAGLRSDVLSLDGLDLPGNAGAAGSA